MKNIVTSVCAIQLVLCLSSLQPALPQTINKYLGQIPPQGTTIRRFPPDNMLLLAVNGVWMWHGSPSFSPDFKEMFFVKYLNPIDRSEIWYTHLVNNQWTIPVQASFGNRTVIENSPIFSPTGDTLYFYSQRTANSPFYQSFKQPDGSWSLARALSSDFLNGHPTGWNLSIADNRNLYFECIDGIYRSKWINGSYAQSERLPDQINNLSNEGSAFIDPDEEYLLFISNRPGGSGLHDLYISYAEKDGGWTPSLNLGTWINSSQEDGFPRVSPEGKYLFFNTARGASGDQGYNPYWVSAAFIDLMRPIEPDTSNRVAFYSERDGNAEIYSMFPDGSDLKRLTTNTFPDLDPAWSNDGEKIAFTSDRDGNFELYTINADGSNSQKLTQTGRQVGTPYWSPDGTKILFSVMDDTFSEEGDIAVVHTDGSGFQILSAAGKGCTPAWTDDGSAIIFSSKRNGHFEICLVDGEGNNIQEITRNQTDKINARLSPDGQRIVYTLFSTDGANTEIHVMNADGTGDIRLTRPGNLSKNPVWSADGKQIFFQNKKFGNNEIFQMQADGKHPVNISRNTLNDSWPNLIRKSTVSGIPDRGNLLNKACLKSIYPNPADDTVVIEFSLSQTDHVGLVVADLLGRPVIKLIDENRPEGNHQIKTDLAGLAPGIYTVILKSSHDLFARKLIKN